MGKQNDEWEETKTRGVEVALKVERSGECKFNWVLSLRYAADILKESHAKGVGVYEVLAKKNK